MSTLNQRNLTLEIQSLLRGAASPDELVDEVAGEYAALCESCNSRCAEVASLLVEGLRDEAVEIAEREPRLLPLIAKLDFPQRRDWLGFLAMRGFESPPELNLESAAIIEEAYEQQRKLEPLMRTHRRLALSRSPLQVRIQVLRKLEEADPTNPIWPADIEKFEHARIEQIRREATTARSKLDLETLARLSEELSGLWSIRIPADLRNSVSVSNEMLARQRATNEMKPLLAELNECLTAFDADKALNIREKWNQLNQTAQLGEGNPIYEEAKEALLWLQEVDRERAEESEYNRAIAKLEAGLDEELDLSLLEQRWYTVQKFRRDIPIELEQRFAEYKERLIGVQRRRVRLRIAAAAAGILLVASLVGWFLFNQSRRSQLRDAREQMSGLVETNNLESAEQYFRGLPGFVQGDSEILKGLESIRAADAADNQRKSQFEESLTSINLERDLDEQTDKILQTAESLAASDGERTQIALTRGKVDAERERRLKDRTEKFLVDVNRLADALKDAEKKPPTQESQAELTRIKANLAELQSGHQGKKDGRPLVAAAALGQVNTLILRAETRLRGIGEYQKSLQRIADISKATGNPDLFGKALVDFSNDYPATPWAADFRKSASEQKVWDGLNAWQSLTRDPAWPRLAELEQAEATRLLAQIDKLEQSLAIATFSNRTSKLKRLLTQINVGRALDQEKAIQGILKIFDTSEYRNQAIVVEKSDDGKPDRWRYLRGWFRPDSNSERFNYDYFKDLFKDEKACKTGNNRHKSEISQIGLAGQCKMANELVRAAGTFSGSSTDDLFLNLLEITCKKYESAEELTEVDPIVQVLAIKKVLELAGKSSPGLGELTKTLLSDITAGAFDEVDWFDGNSPQTISKRQEAASLLAKLSGLSQNLRDGINTWRSRVAADGELSEIQAFEWVGWMRTVEGSVEIHGTQKLDNGVELFVLLPTGQGNVAEFASVGSHNGGFVSNTPDVERSLQSGRPVFAKQPLNSKASQ